MSNNYSNESIDMLVGAERIRTRPASMLGSSGLAGARHGFIELVGNAQDESTAGFGTRLDVKHYADGSVSIRDYGRGVPMGWNTNPKVMNWNWHAIYNELYGGGKYATNQDKLKAITDWGTFDPKAYNYLFSVGLNGLGAASTQYTSEFFRVRSYKNGVCTKRDFSRGVPLVNGKPYDMFSATLEERKAIPEEKEPTTEPDGTFIHWKPDDTVFTDINIGADWLLEKCKEIAGVTGIELNFEDEVTDRKINIPSGDLKDLLKSKTGSSLVNLPLIEASNLTHGTVRVEADPDFVWVCQCNIVLSHVSNRVNSNCYHNSVRMQGGIQYEAIMDALYSFFTDISREKEVKIKNTDYEDIISVIVSTYSNYASFRNQTKDEVDDMFIYNTVKSTLLDKLVLEYHRGNTTVLTIVQKAIDNAKERLSDEELVSLAKKVNKVKREKAPLKFASCDAYENKQYSEVELWLTEGDSAGGAVKDARNSEFQAVFPLKGKGLNVAKASYKKILENKEIKELFAILGVGFDLDIKGENFFNMNDLKVGKIIIATDADEDGFQIRVLLFLTFYKLAPRLLKEGRVFIAETPRFGITLKNGKTLYARDDTHRDKIKEEYKSSIATIKRYKGLGEVDADVLHETTVNPTTRNLVPLTCDFDNEFEVDLINALFGEDKEGQRKSIISTVLGTDVSDMLEDNALLINSIEDEDIDEDIEYEEV